MLCHVFEDSQTTAYMKNLDTSYFQLLKTLLQYFSNKTNTQTEIYTSRLSFKVTANELQYFSNKTNKQTEIYTLRLSFKTQLKD